MISEFLDIDYDKRQLTIMIQKINDFEQGDLFLSSLINDLESLVYVLTSHDQEWKNTFIGYWWDLEQVIAVVMEEERSHLSTEEIRIVKEALEELTKMTKSKLDEYRILEQN